MSEYYVSPLGNDAWSGRTEDSAFATLDAAIKAMAADAGGATYVLGGHYYLNGSGVALTNANSNATITAYPGANPVISGGTAIPASSWSIGADGIWTAEVGSDDIGQLTVDGERQTLARFPNTAPDNPNRSGWLWAQALPDGGNPLRQLAYNPADFPIGQNPTVGQQATVFDANNWSNSILKIAAVDTTSHVITFDGAATYYVGPGSRYFISGSKPLLDQRGEWYLDHATGILYFNPPSGFNGAGAVVSGNISLIDISHAENITISGLTFSDAATNAQNEALINTAAVNVNASVGISITGNHFSNVARGVHIGGNSNGNLVSNNDFSNIWGQSVSLSRGTSHNRVVHNAIENSGNIFAAASAIQLNSTSSNIVSNNHIINVPRSGISAVYLDATVQSGANVIEHNSILHSGQATDDSGAIYIASPGVSSSQPDTIRFNTIDDAGGLGTANGGFISRQNASAAGIYVDVGLIGTKISGNVIQGTTLGGVYLQGSSNNEVHDNIVSMKRTISDSDREIHVSLVPVSGVAMSGNSVYDNAFSSSEVSTSSATEAASDSDSSGGGAGTAVEAGSTSESSIWLPAINLGPPVSVGAGATAVIGGASAQSVTFAGSTGTLILDDAPGFTGQVSGLAGSDAIDLADVSYGAGTQATFLGTTTSGTLTITDGTDTANIALQGDYLSSSWDVSSDGNGGTVVVDPVSTNTWQVLPVGAGGFLDGFSIADDGTMVVRTDTDGAYIWNGTEWQQLITATSMPADFVANAQLYSQGVLELQVAPSNSSVLYMVYAVYEPNAYPPLEGVYKSTNEGATWTLTSFTPIADTTMNANGPYRMWGQNMAVDPINPNIVYVGTGANGLFVTTDGGNTWTSVSGVPTATSDGNGNYPGITGILFDPANTNVIFAASYGNGVYETTNGGTSWSKLSAGPSGVQQAAISSNGTYYAIDGSDHLWVYANGTWTEPLSGAVGVAVDPFNPNHVVVTQIDGQLDESFNSGTTWGGWSQQPTDVANDIPYQAIFGTNAEGLAFDPATPGVLYINGNRSFWSTTLSGNITTSTVPTWTDQGIGIEQLCANEIIVAPVANSTPLVASWDTAVIAPNGSTYASTFGPVANGAVVAGWSIDYASSDPNFIVVLADGGYAGGPQESGYSTNDGQTWNPFPTLPPGGSFGGDIAASTPENIIFASANGVQPYYTLNGGETWNPISLPGVSSWSGFIGAYFDDNQVITADRVLANTFYLLFNGVGVFETTNGGVNWTEVNSNVTSGHQLLSTPGEAGNLWLVSGTSGNAGNQGPANVGGSLLHSTNGGATWTTVANVTEPYCMGFGAAAPGQSYPALYMVGWVNGVYGVWQSINEAQSWTSIGTWPNGNLDTITTISGDPNVFGKVYVGLAGGGYQVFSADGPSVLEIDTSPSSALGEIGTTVTLKLAMSEVTTVAGGTPTLTLNDGGTATYVGGSGTDALTFSYTAAAGQNAAALAATALNLNGATMTDSGGNAANLSLTGLAQTGPQIDTALPAVTAVADSATSGTLEPGATTTLTLNMSEAVTVNTSGGTPTLTLNDGGVATYTGGSGTNALTFSYTVGAGQSTSSLAATAVNLNGATVTNANGGANLSLSGLTQTGPQVDGTPTLAIDGTGFSGSYASATSASVTLTTANPNDVIILDVAYNGPAITSISDTAGLTWHERAVAGSSGSQIYQYYAVAPNALAADSITVNFSGTTSYHAIEAFGIVGANTSSPFDTNAAVPGTSNSATVSATTSNANDLILAAYRFYSSTPTAGSGWNTIDGGSNGYLSEYKIVSATQAGLVATASAGQNGGIIDAVVAAAAPVSTGPTVSSIIDSPSSGDLNAGKTVTLTLGMSAAVTVSGGTPTLTLNDGGTAIYTGGSGTNTLSFSYSVPAGQNSPHLMVSAVSLNGATLQDSAGNAANLSISSLTQSGPQIGTTAPAAPVITNDTVNANDTVTLTGSAEANSTIHVLNGTDVLGTTSANASGSWNFTTGELTAGSYTFSATATDAAGNTSAVSSGIDPTIGLPGAPAIVSFSPDSGPAAADVTNAKILTLTGTAPAASTVEVYDGSTELGTTTATAAGTWSYTTGTLADGAHSFTATDTVAVNVSAASAALTVTVDTIAPNAPQIVNDTINANDRVTLSGTAAANSTLNLFDGSTELGTTTANGSGAWSYTTGTLGNGAHSFTATDTDVAGNVSAASAAVIADLASVAPTAPIIVSDTVSASDTLTLGGTAEANSTINILDGSSELGTTTANGSGAWNYTTGALGNGAHSFTATDTDAAGNVSLASTAVIADLGSVAPTAPIIVSDTVSASDTLTLGGTAEANSTINIFDGSSELGTTTANGSGAWNYKTGALGNGAHSFTATDTDAAGNVSPASAAVLADVGSVVPTAPIIVSDAVSASDTVTLGGTAETNSTINVFDGSTELGTTTANGSGAWSYTTGALANGTHSFTATDVIASEVSAASAALAVTLSAAAPNPARSYAGHGWARGSHAPIGKFIDKATLDDIFGTSSTTVSHHAGDLSASDPTANATTDPSANLGSTSPAPFTHTDIFHDATDTNSNATSNQNNAPDTAVNGSHVIGVLDGSPNPHWTEANASGDSDATSLLNGSAEAPAEWHHNHSSAWQSGNWVSAEAVSGDIQSHSIIFQDATDTSWEGTSNQNNAPDAAVNENQAGSAADGSPNPNWTEANTAADSNPASPPSGSNEAPAEWHHDHSSAWQSGNSVSTGAVSGDIHPALNAALHSIAAGGASLNFAGLAAEVSDAFVFKSDLGNEPIKHLTTALDQINPHDLFEHIIEIHADLHAAAIDNVPEPIDPGASHLNTLHLHSFHVG